MFTGTISADEMVASVVDASSVRNLLLDPSPAILWAISRRIEELRFQDPPAAFGVAEAALEALDCLSVHQQRRALRFALWTAYGSACRATARFDRAERALIAAARIARPGDLRRRAEVAERLAYLRADEGREAETRSLVDFFLEHARLGGGTNLGQRLTAAATIMLRFSDYRFATDLASEALSHLPPNRDRFHLSAVHSLAQASLGASSRPALLSALDVVQETLQRVDRDSSPWLRLHWLAGNLLRCQPLRRYQQGLAALEITRAGIDRKSNPFDRALLVIDIAELHLDSGAPENARDLARDSFSVLHELRNWPEAYRALRTFYRAANDLVLEPSLLRVVRDRLISARR